MSGFSRGLVVSKLRALNATQDSVQSLAQWFLFYQKKSELIVQVWVQEITQGKGDRVLTLLYIVNELVQRARRKPNPYVDAFRAVLEPVFQKVIRKVDTKSLKGITRICDVWVERNVYDAAFVNSLRQYTGNAPPPVAKQATKPAPPQHAPSDPRQRAAPTPPTPTSVSDADGDSDVDVVGGNEDSALSVALREAEKTYVAEALAGSLGQVAPGLLDGSAVNTIKDTNDMQRVAADADAALAACGTHIKAVETAVAKAKAAIALLAKEAQRQQQRAEELAARGTTLHTQHAALEGVARKLSELQGGAPPAKRARTAGAFDTTDTAALVAGMPK